MVSPDEVVRGEVRVRGFELPHRPVREGDTVASGLREDLSGLRARIGKDRARVRLELGSELRDLAHLMEGPERVQGGAEVVTHVAHGVHVVGKVIGARQDIVDDLVHQEAESSSVARAKLRKLIQQAARQKGLDLDPVRVSKHRHLLLKGGLEDGRRGLVYARRKGRVESAIARVEIRFVVTPHLSLVALVALIALIALVALVCGTMEETHNNHRGI